MKGADERELALGRLLGVSALAMSGRLGSDRESAEGALKVIFEALFACRTTRLEGTIEGTHTDERRDATPNKCLLRPWVARMNFCCFVEFFFPPPSFEVPITLRFVLDPALMTYHVCILRLRFSYDGRFFFLSVFLSVCLSVVVRTVMWSSFFSDLFKMGVGEEAGALMHHTYMYQMMWLSSICIVVVLLSHCFFGRPRSLAACLRLGAVLLPLPKI